MLTTVFQLGGVAGVAINVCLSNSAKSVRLLSILRSISHVTNSGLSGRGTRLKYLNCINVSMSTSALLVPNAFAKIRIFLAKSGFTSDKLADRFAMVGELVNR